jgi:hypothetical protein
MAADLIGYSALMERADGTTYTNFERAGLGVASLS